MSGHQVAGFSLRESFHGQAVASCLQSVSVRPSESGPLCTRIMHYR